jgi:hypothetical protein
MMASQTRLRISSEYIDKLLSDVEDPDQLQADLEREKLEAGKCS